MKISKQILLVAPILFLIFASGCSKNLIQFDDTAQPQPKEENVNAVDTSSGQKANSGSGQDSDIAKQGLPGNGSAGSFSADGGKEGSGLAGKTGNNNGEASSVSESGAGISTGKKSGEVDTFFGFGPNANARNFGSAKQGMPGNGAAGSFSAGPFEEKKGGVGSNPESSSEFFTEENIGEVNTPSHLYEKPGSRSFGSAKQGMPGNGATGSFSAEPSNEGIIEPFIEESGLVAQLPKEEEIRRQLPYHFSIHLQDIHFAFDKFDLTDKTRAILRQNADYLKAHPNFKIEIQGHCDERGSNNYNITLGERRVRSTQSYLISQEIDESRIHTISYGEERPFCFESNKKCWYQNRRAHFLLAQ